MTLAEKLEGINKQILFLFLLRSDARRLFRRVPFSDKITRMLAGFVSIAYTGMAYVKLWPESELDVTSPQNSAIVSEFVTSFGMEN